MLGTSPISRMHQGSSANPKGESPSRCRRDEGVISVARLTIYLFSRLLLAVWLVTHEQASCCTRKGRQLDRGHVGLRLVLMLSMQALLRVILPHQADHVRIRH